MRTEDDKRSDDLSDQQRRTPQQSQMPPSHHSKEMDRSSTPGDMTIDEDPGTRPSRPPSNVNGKTLSNVLNNELIELERASSLTIETFSVNYRAQRLADIRTGHVRVPIQCVDCIERIDESSTAD